MYSNSCYLPFSIELWHLFASGHTERSQGFQSHCKGGSSWYLNACVPTTLSCECPHSLFLQDTTLSTQFKIVLPKSVYKIPSGSSNSFVPIYGPPHSWVIHFCQLSSHVFPVPLYLPRIITSLCQLVEISSHFLWRHWDNFSSCVVTKLWEWLCYLGGFPDGSVVKNPPAMQEM